MCLVVMATLVELSMFISVQAAGWLSRDGVTLSSFVCLEKNIPQKGCWKTFPSPLQHETCMLLIIVLLDTCGMTGLCHEGPSCRLHA